MEVTEEQNILEGVSLDDNIAVGKCILLKSETAEVTPKTINQKSVKKHKNRFLKAKNELLKELELLTDQISDTSTEEIIEAQKQIASDPEIERNVFEIIESKLLNVDFAVYQTYCVFIERLKESGSALFRQRIVDLEDLRDRFVTLVSNKGKSKRVAKNTIIVTKEISPTDLVSYYEDGVKGVIIEKGGVTSHSAIIAKSLGIPCMVNVESATETIQDHSEIILDGQLEKIFYKPSAQLIKEYKKKVNRLESGLRPDDSVVSETKDGYKFNLMANIEFEAELSEVKTHQAKGIGLLRTESLLFGHRIRKSAEEQEVFYGNILSKTEHEVIIRLFDIGGDKNSSFSNKEPNPFLGWRGIRLLLDEERLLKNQLIAILKTAEKFPGRVKILVPMVSVLEEVHQIKAIVNDVQKHLSESGFDVKEEVPIGLMVEVPSVAVMAYQFAQEVDFFSIGTNDLTQYTLAVDRGNERIYDLFQHLHPAVLKLINETVKGAKKAGISVSICGELAGNKIGAACALGMGITELSMVPRAIPKIKGMLNSRKLEDFCQLANEALKQSSTEGVKKIFKQWNSSK